MPKAPQKITTVPNVPVPNLLAPTAAEQSAVRANTPPKENTAKDTEKNTQKNTRRRAQTNGRKRKKAEKTKKSICALFPSRP